MTDQTGDSPTGRATRPSRRTDGRPRRAPSPDDAPRRSRTWAGAGSSGVRRRAHPDRGDGGGRRPGAPARLGRGRRRDPRTRTAPPRTADAAAPSAPEPAPARLPDRRSARTDGALLLVDQRRLPDALVEYTVQVRRRGGLRDPRDGRPRRAGDRPGGGHRARPDRGEAARTSQPYARRATLRGARQRPASTRDRPRSTCAGRSSG